MKGDPKVIELLNEALKEELTAINQYWLHYRMLDNWGVKALAEYERHESIDEMKHADSLAERILFLDGLPNFQALGRLRIGENVEEILKADMEAEQSGAKLYRDLIAHAQVDAAINSALPTPIDELYQAIAVPHYVAAAIARGRVRGKLAAQVSS